MRTVILHGELGKRFGRLHNFDIRNVSGAVRALCANFPDFRSYMLAPENNAIGYKVLVGEEELETLDAIHDPVGRSQIKIVPVITGGGAVTRIFIGAALIAASVYFTGGLGIGAGLSLAGVSSSIGIALTLGGISQLLAGSPESNGPSERPEDKPSYLFDGAVNTTSQGHPVPIGYGRLIVGSQVISAGLQIEDISDGAHELDTDQVFHK